MTRFPPPDMPPGIECASSGRLSIVSSADDEQHRPVGRCVARPAGNDDRRVGLSSRRITSVHRNDQVIVTTSGGSSSPVGHQFDHTVPGMPIRAQPQLSRSMSTAEPALRGLYHRLVAALSGGGPGNSYKDPGRGQHDEHQAGPSHPTSARRGRPGPADAPRQHPALHRAAEEVLSMTCCIVTQLITATCKTPARSAPTRATPPAHHERHDDACTAAKGDIDRAIHAAANSGPGKARRASRRSATDQRRQPAEHESLGTDPEALIDPDDHQRDEATDTTLEEADDGEDPDARCPDKVALAGCTEAWPR